MSNLAHKFIGAGFLDEAEEICQRAINMPDYDQQIGTAISGIREMRQKDEKGEQETLERARKLRSPYIGYAHACSKKAIPDIEGIWLSPLCPFKIVIKSGIFEAKGSFENRNPLANLYESGPRRVETTFSGVVSGHGVRYSELRKTEGSTSEVKHEGIMVLSDDLKDITVYPEGTVEGYNWHGISQIEAEERT